MKSYNVRWYLRSLFPHPLTEIVLGIVVVSQYYVLAKYPGNQFGFVSLSQLLLLPLYGLMMSFHIIRDPRLTIFELSLLKSWRAISVAKVVVLAIGFVPLIVADAILICYFNQDLIAFFIGIWICEYLAVTCLASLVRSQSGALLIVMSFGILIPFGVFSVLSYTTSTHVILNATMSGVMYVLAPILTYSYYEQGMVQMAPLVGGSVVLIVSFLLIGIYFAAFGRAELEM